MVCFCARPPDAFADFCFQRYKVDGHGVSVGDPRHPLSICGSCVRTHVEHELAAGKLVVRCPAEGCGRALQTRELATHSATAAYEALVSRIRDAEDGHDQAAVAAALREAATAGVELRCCPKCKVLIEKNQVRSPKPTVALSHSSYILMTYRVVAGLLVDAMLSV